jgi:hypothetical protein
MGLQGFLAKEGNGLRRNARPDARGLMTTQLCIPLNEQVDNPDKLRLASALQPLGRSFQMDTQ